MYRRCCFTSLTECSIHLAPSLSLALALSLSVSCSLALIFNLLELRTHCKVANKWKSAWLEINGMIYLIYQADA